MAQSKSQSLKATVSEDSKSKSKWTETELLNLNTWIYCICLVDFDLTEGQLTKLVYPFDILSCQEKANIANLSFPDTHTSNNDVVNAKFVFRFRARMMKEGQSKLSGKQKLCYSHRHKSHPYLFGYVYFRQKPDKSIERGYFQKAIVIITPIPYIHVFIQAAEIIGSLYFEYKAGIKILDTACRNICCWPLPNLEGDVSLPLLGHIIGVILQPKSVPPSASILLPRHHQFAHKKHPHLHLDQKKRNSAENGYQLVDKHATHSTGGCFQEINIYRYFHVVLGNLWCLWELALTGQALLVIASSAQECSHSVLGIMSLISPIAYHGDFRPYFTIYDDDFKHFCNLHDRDMLPPLILGVTNPFFLKVMPKFPHILVLSNGNITNNMMGNAENHDNENSDNEHDQMDEDENEKKDKNTKSVMTIHVKTTNTDQHQPTVKKNSQRAWGPVKEVDVTKSHNTIISKSTPCLFPDEQVLSRLLTVSKATTSSGISLNTNELEIEQVCILNNATLRKYFQHLTEKFLEPFQEYFTFKVASGLWNPYLNPPNLKTFQKDNFLNIIRDIPKSFLNEIPLRTSTLPTGKRSVLVKLYSKFLKSPHFPSWFNKKRERAKRKCDKIIHKMIRKIKFERLVEGKPVREGIKMYQTIHRHMNNNNQSAKPKADLNDVLIRHRAVLRSALPSQIIEALDEQVEKMRKDQIKKRKEWQIKYQQHLKQQRAVYNLDDHGNDNDNEEELKNDFNDDSSSHSLGNTPSEQISRSKSFESKHKKKKKKSAKSPNKMLTSPSLNNDSFHNSQSISSLTSASSVLTTPSFNRNDFASSPEQNSSLKSMQGSNDKAALSEDASQRSKKVKLSASKSDIFDHSSPNVFTSSMSMGLGGGLAPNINFNIHKYHRYHNKSDLFHKQRNGITKSADYRHSTKTKIANKHNRIKRKQQGNNGGAHSFDETETINHQNFVYFQYQQRQRQRASLHSDPKQPHDQRESDAVSISSYKKIKNKNKFFAARQRQRASSSESMSMSSNTQIHAKKEDMERKFSKDDNYTSHYKYYAGMRNMKNRNDSPKMAPVLFDLSNINEFVAANDTESVVTNSFTSARDDNYKLFENHF